MLKIIKTGNKVIVTLNSGKVLERDNIDDKDFSKLCSSVSDEDTYSIMCPDYSEKRKEYENNKRLIELAEKSSNIRFNSCNNSFYWYEISSLSLPIELVKVVLDAECNKDEEALAVYKNFWTLLSLNPSEECRKNLFWFLSRNGIVLSKHGFFVAYRNVSPTDAEDVYTDCHTKTFKIKIGEVVTMPREECDCSSKNECSRGLHLASKNWLRKNYYGTVGLVCLCNPADVVAVPYNSEYGKLRTCAYIPIDKIEYNTQGEVIPFPAEIGFDCPYVAQVIYEGLMGTEEDSTYKLVIPELPEINQESIKNGLLDIAMQSIINREV